jgi:hypothetical protein
LWKAKQVPEAWFWTGKASKVCCCWTCVWLERKERVKEVELRLWGGWEATFATLSLTHWMQDTEELLSVEFRWIWYVQRKNCGWVGTVCC